MRSVREKFGGLYRQAGYSASKSGLLGLTRNVTLEYADQGITCNAVLPGLIEPQDVQWDTIDVTALNLPALASPPAGVPDPTFDYLGTLSLGSGPAPITRPGGTARPRCRPRRAARRRRG